MKRHSINFSFSFLHQLNKSNIDCSASRIHLIIYTWREETLWYKKYELIYLNNKYSFIGYIVEIQNPFLYLTSIITAILFIFSSRHFLSSISLSPSKSFSLSIFETLDSSRNKYYMKRGKMFPYRHVFQSLHIKSNIESWY